MKSLNVEPFLKKKHTHTFWGFNCISNYWKLSI